MILGCANNQQRGGDILAWWLWAYGHVAVCTCFLTVICYIASLSWIIFNSFRGVRNRFSGKRKNPKCDKRRINEMTRAKLCVWFMDYRINCVVLHDFITCLSLLTNSPDWFHIIHKLEINFIKRTRLVVVHNSGMHVPIPCKTTFYNHCHSQPDADAAAIKHVLLLSNCVAPPDFCR